MLHEIYSYQRLGERAGPARTVDAGESRLNPWLLWRPEGLQAPQVLTSAEMDECRCPDLCNRDHVNE